MNITTKFITRGKNKEMLAQLKCDLKENLELYFSEKKIHPRRKEELRNNIGVLFMKLSELATLRYKFNEGKNNSGLIYELPYDIIRDEISIRLWRIIERNKFDTSRLIQNNSTYSYFMKCANNFAMDIVRKRLEKNPRKIRAYSMDSFKNENEEPIRDNKIEKNIPVTMSDVPLVNDTSNNDVCIVRRKDNTGFIQIGRRQPVYVGNKEMNTTVSKIKSNKNYHLVEQNI